MFDPMPVLWLLGPMPVLWFLGFLDQMLRLVQLESWQSWRAARQTLALVAVAFVFSASIQHLSGQFETYVVEEIVIDYFTTTVVFSELTCHIQLVCLRASFLWMHSSLFGLCTSFFLRYDLRLNPSLNWTENLLWLLFSSSPYLQCLIYFFCRRVRSERGILSVFFEETSVGKLAHAPKAVRKTLLAIESFLQNFQQVLEPFTKALDCQYFTAFQPLWFASQDPYWRLDKFSFGQLITLASHLFTHQNAVLTSMPLDVFSCAYDATLETHVRSIFFSCFTGSDHTWFDLLCHRNLL